ncbi:MAG TPA: glycosyltransferase family 4 protein [Gemmatimonadaceae bacterium]|nr:glycosyltransferase family 4 protein [Gemmatimonadaceae bacterium]
MHIFVVTNDFPPRIGGINYYVDQIMRRFPPGSVTIFSSSFAGWQAFDRAYPHDVIRLETEMMLPSPSVRRRLHDELRARKPDVVLFGATWPLGHMGPAIKRKLGIPFAGFTHGLELTGTLVPGLLRHIGRDAALLTAASKWARRELEKSFGWEGRMEVLPSGIDTQDFRPDVSDAVVRERHALGSAPVVCCVSRLVARKGQDLLIRALPAVARAVPDVKLLIVGIGPYEAALRKLAVETGVADRVVFTGAAPYAELPAYFRAGDVFAMPCRVRWFGFDVEALGAVFLQGAAVGRPVIAGDSGGAPETVIPGKTGLVVDPTRPEPLAEAITSLLTDRARAEAMGKAGAEWVHTEWTWDRMTAHLDQALKRVLNS